jgi:agmatine deiminase
MASFRMPAEWEPHAATYLVWPHNRDTWPGKFDLIPPAFAQLAVAIARFEPVRLLVEDDHAVQQAKRLITIAGADYPAAIERIEFVPIPTNDSWIRDYGPIFVNRRVGASDPAAQLALDWRFNSWGEKYGRFDLDDVVPHRLAERYGFEVVEPGIVLEGGAIDVNGAGILITTESCLFNPNRNPSLTRSEIEDYLKTYLGVSSVLWLGEGIVGDDTDGHVDDLARFVGTDTIVTVFEPDPADDNYHPLADNLERLRKAHDLNDRPFRIETLPMPPPMYYDNTRLPASYANFYMVNGGIIMPTFGCAADKIAQDILKRVMPDRQIVGVYAADIVWGLGTAHCLTQQHPAIGSVTMAAAQEG